MDTSQYLSLFLEESAENIENLNQSMLELEKEPGNIDLVNEIFRYAHTLKGMSATMGYNDVAELTHSMENILDKLRNGNLAVSKELMTVLFQCIDTLERMVGNISEGSSEKVDCSSIISKISNLMEVKPQASAQKIGNEGLELNQYDIDVLKEAKDKLYDSYEITITLSKDCQMKSVRAYLVFHNLQEHGEIIKSNPSAELIEQEEFDTTFSVIYLTQREKEFIKNIIDNISEIEYSSIELIDMNKMHARAETEVQVEQKDLAPVTKEKQENNHGKKLGQSVRVDIDRLDSFMNLVGELVIHRTRLEQISSSNHLTELNETLEQVGRTTSDLQDLVMKVRMISLDRIFNRLPRMVRDLSTELNKEIEFTINGQDTELDRTVVDELGDSIVHLLRNAVDHGIENKDERAKTGKSPVGHITITAYQEGNKAVIKLLDDGRGLDVDKIKQKAQSKGINTDGMTDSDIINLIFLQGFSTSEKVTDISGRGVGMDIVRTKVTSIGGSIDVKSEKGRGTTFTIHMPLTLSIIQALLVKVSNETFAISLGFIDKVINMKQEDIRHSNNKEVIVYRGDIIPIIRLSKRLGLDYSDNNEYFIVIVKIGEKQVGLVVDSLVGQQEIVIKPLGKSLKSIKEYVGATILGNGLVTLILDVVSII